MMGRMGGFQVRRQAGAEGAILLSGTVDEHAHVGAAFGAIDGPTVINMRGVERINSMGVHRWLTAFAELTARHAIVVEEVPYAVAMQANMVASFFGTAEVRSAIAPYYCAACKASHQVVVDRSELGEGNTAPAKPCPSCKRPMEFEELDGYFSFFEAAE
jgi:hypothetical protein